MKFCACWRSVQLLVDGLPRWPLSSCHGLETIWKENKLEPHLSWCPSDLPTSPRCLPYCSKTKHCLLFRYERIFAVIYCIWPLLCISGFQIVLVNTRKGRFPHGCGQWQTWEPSEFPGSGKQKHKRYSMSPVHKSVNKGSQELRRKESSSSPAYY